MRSTMTATSPAATMRPTLRRGPKARSPKQLYPLTRVETDGREWRQQAIETYQQAERVETGALAMELAARLLTLTGRVVAREAVVVDRAAHTATVTVDGTLFQLQGQQLVLLRPCADCGTGLYPSPAIQSLADLGHALSAWQPRCPDCLPGDLRSWTTDEAVSL
jgi:hypothetical protein